MSLLTLSEEDTSFLKQSTVQLLEQLKDLEKQTNEKKKKLFLSIKERSLKLFDMGWSGYDGLVKEKHGICAYIWNELKNHEVYYPQGDFVDLFNDDERWSNPKITWNSDEIITRCQKYDSLNSHQTEQRKSTIVKIMMELEKTKFMENLEISGKKFIHLRGLQRKTKSDMKILRKILDSLVINGIILECHGTNRSRLFCLPDSNTGRLLNN